jgi:hypothetical protein
MISEENKIKKMIERAKIEAKECGVFCSCGRKVIPSYEGEVVCPEEDRIRSIGVGNEFSYDEYLKIKSDHTYFCDQGRLDVFDFIVRFFNLNEEELK